MRNIRHYKIQDVPGYICELTGESEYKRWEIGSKMGLLRTGHIVCEDGIHDDVPMLEDVLCRGGVQIVDAYAFFDDERNPTISLYYPSGLMVNYKVLFHPISCTMELRPVWYKKQPSDPERIYL